MGIRRIELVELCDALRSGVLLGNVATLGRQWLLATKHETSRCLGDLSINQKLVNSLLRDYPKWSEPLFRILGAESVVSFDASGYESSDYVADFNFPLDLQFYQKFDFVFDGGTSEHIFDVRQVFLNLMHMVRIGGHLMCVVPCNNHLGHGFYQFSPELYFRIFSAENGFRVKRMTLTSPDARDRYEVVDPAKLGQRVEMFGSPSRLSLAVLAERTHEATIFSKVPQQSDYEVAWKGKHNQRPQPATGLRGAAIRTLTRYFPSLLVAIRFQRSKRLSAHPRFFRRVS